MVQSAYTSESLQNKVMSLILKREAGGTYTLKIN